ncbi:bifunctional alpha/beta hydrolase/OsmC family protein [soil metagenome]
MDSKKVFFNNNQGNKISGRIILPPHQQPHNFAIFAHCFTCNKNFNAVRNISRALLLRGFGVLQFDFTGLGDSEGDFSKTNFSGNVEDLVAAAQFLKEKYESPSLLIGHSLGGAAVILGAMEIDSVKAVATIGAPAHPSHVRHLFEGNIDEIQKTGEALVNLGGRKFTIKNQFLEDLEKHPLSELLQKMRKAILILHSPQDSTVGINNAAELFSAAFHPKSFVSLDGADHLLSNKEDSQYAGEVIASWSRRYINEQVQKEIISSHQVAALLEKGHKFTTSLKIGKHYLVSDEPAEVGGENYGPTPYDLLSSSLAACTAMTIKIYAKHKKWELEDVEVYITHSKDHAEDFQQMERKSAKIDVFNREIRLTGNLDESQRQRMLEIADKCPVHRTLHSKVEIRTKMKE